MKKVIIFAAVLAIAMLTALSQGLYILFYGIGITFLVEYSYFSLYSVKYSEEDYSKKLRQSRGMVLMHAGWYLCTLLCAAVGGVLDGYDYLVEAATSGNITYITVHQDCYAWWVLFVLLLARFFEQVLIEKDIKKNINLMKRRKG